MCRDCEDASYQILVMAGVMGGPSIGGEVAGRSLQPVSCSYILLLYLLTLSIRTTLKALACSTNRRAHTAAAVETHYCSVKVLLPQLLTGGKSIELHSHTNGTVG